MDHTAREMANLANFGQALETVMNEYGFSLYSGLFWRNETGYEFETFGTEVRLRDRG